jgi:hypothetical protein
MSPVLTFHHGYPGLFCGLSDHSKRRHIGLITLNTGVLVTRLVLLGLLTVSMWGCSASPSSSDGARFKVKRLPLTDGTLDGEIMPARIGSYDMRPYSGWRAPTDATRHYVGLYENRNGQEILLIAILNTNPTAQQAAVSADVTKAECEDPAGFATAYPDNPIPYVFSSCKGSQQFSWINGNWIITASTYHKTDVGDLIGFVNLYAH